MVLTSYGRNKNHDDEIKKTKRRPISLLCVYLQAVQAEPHGALLQCDKSTRRIGGTGDRPEGNKRRSTSLRSTEWQGTPTRAPLQQTHWLLSSRAETAIGFLPSELQRPACVVRTLLLIAGIERNPGPIICKECQRKVGSNSIKCTWCGMWVHQKCSGISTKDIRKLAKEGKYIYECPTCTAARKIAESGPKGRRRGKKSRRNEEQRKERMRRRNEKRKTNIPIPDRAESDTMTIATWNLQGVAVRQQNRERLRRALSYAGGKGWDILLITEIRSESEGVIWLGEGDGQTAVIHSSHCGIALLRRPLQQWCEGNKRMDLGKRVTTVQLGNLHLISAYQPHSGHPPQAIETFRSEMERAISRCPREATLIIGGDFNSHNGRDYGRSAATGPCGLETKTTASGEELVAWCEERSLQWVNSFYHTKRRGTWFSKLAKKWYEIDGFIMRGRDRHRLVGKIQVTQDLSLSDHKPVTISIRIGLKTNRVLRRMPPKINAEILRSTAAKAKFKEYTEEKYTNQGDWDSMAKVLTDAAKEVCGTTTKQVENPWILGNEAELTDLHKTISDLVIRRNEALSRREYQGHHKGAPSCTTYHEKEAETARGRVVAETYRRVQRSSGQR